jgi:alpha-D-xyloside xylohydrolase
MKHFPVYFLALISLCIAVSASAFIQVEDGVLIPLEKKNLTDPAQIKIQICAENIIRIIATPGKMISSRTSLMIHKDEWPKTNFLITEEGEYLVVTTSRIRVKVHQKTGAVSFYDLKGGLLLQEKSEGGRLISPAEVMGEETYHIQQLFESPDDEAFYGLGQHQNGVMNYKGSDVDLWQHNIVAVVPFLVSSKNYGILWDNNSRTRFGDIREFQSLSAFRLIDADGNEGGLTAEYYKDADFTELAIHIPMDSNEGCPQFAGEVPSKPLNRGFTNSGSIAPDTPKCGSMGNSSWTTGGRTGCPGPIFPS